METIMGYRASKIKALTFLETVYDYLKEDITVREMTELAEKIANHVDGQVAEALAKSRGPVAVTPNYDRDNPPRGPIPKPKALKD